MFAISGNESRKKLAEFGKIQMLLFVFFWINKISYD